MTSAAAERFVGQAMSELSDSMRAWFGEAWVRGNLKREVQHDLREAQKDEGMKMVGVNGAGVILASFGLSRDGRDRPEAMVRWRDFGVEHVESVGKLKDAVQDFARQAGVQSPERIGLYVGESGGTLSGDGVRLYAHYVGAPIARMRAMAPPRGGERIAMREAADVSFYDDYAAMYEAFWTENPELKLLVRRETKEEMEEYRLGGGLRLIDVDGEFAGVIAAIRGQEHGMRGWRMRERVLSPKFKGSGLGQAVLWRFVESLDAGEEDALWGTISPENQPSLRSALAMGREVVGSVYWVACEGEGKRETNSEKQT